MLTSTIKTTPQWPPVTTIVSLALALGVLTVACIFATHAGDEVTFVEAPSASAPPAALAARADGHAYS